MMNLSAAVRFHAARAPERPALIFDGRSISYGELNERVGRLACVLEGLGVEPGGVVAVLMKNSAAFVELVLAASYVGAVFLPLNYRLTRSEIDTILDHAGATALFADRELADRVSGSVTPTVFLDADARRDGCAGNARPGAIPEPTVRRSRDVFRLIYTSGTTGRPKGVIQTYANFYWKGVDLAIALGLRAEDRLLVAGPLYHVGASDLPGLAILWFGGCMSIAREFEPDAVLTAIERDALTGAWLAPVMLRRLIASQPMPRRDLSTLRWVIGGGEATDRATLAAFGSLFPRARYLNSYGLTETGGGDTLMDAASGASKAGSSGRPLMHVEIGIRDPSGASVESPGVGEICLRGEKVTPGYHRDRDADADAFYPDGWFRSGDVGWIDGDGYLFVVDRLKDIIVSGGENIAAAEIEAVLLAVPGVSDVAVVGIADADWGQRPAAAVVLAAPDACDEDTLRAACRTHLARFKQPKRIAFLDRLPRNASGKVAKAQLREHLGDGGDHAARAPGRMTTRENAIIDEDSSQ